MEVILLQKIKGLGVEGDLVKVADGYARNYLVPKDFAVIATKSNVKKIDEIKRKQLSLERKELEQAQQLAEKLANVSCTIAVRVGEDDKLFGSVTSLDIAKILEREGVPVDKRKIHLDEPIRSLGVFPVDIKLHHQVTGVVKVWVVKE
ncbi:50S ribosomal protein L9 [bacterium]|nr:50S ribosomal protein L9 [bacterium]MCP5462789.1 50S ribosomal protein L9 [bacterium]